jgi:RNA-directed DNA polymerase
VSHRNLIPRESGLTSLWSFVTREFEQPTQEAKQMTAGATPAGAVSHDTGDWHAIDWRSAHRIVRRLQARIVKATQAGRGGQVKACQQLLTHALSGKAFAVKRVTANSGQRTPGVDGDIWDSPARKTAAIGRRHQRG